MAISKNRLTSITMYEFLITLVVAAAIWVIFKHYYNKRRFFKLGNKLPGPKPWPIIGNAWHFLGTKHDIITKLKRYQAKHKLLALWFGHNLHIFLYSPEFTEIFCRSSKLLDRNSKIKLLKSVAPKGAMIANGPEWRRARKLMEPALDYAAIKNAIPVIENQCDILIQRLQGEVGKPNFPLLPYLKALLFDTMGDITVDFKDKAQKLQMPLVHEIHEFMECVHNRMYNPLYQIEFLYKFLPEGKKFYSLLDSIKTYVNKVIIDKIDTYKEEKKKQIANGNLEKPKKQIFWKTLMDEGTLSVSEIRDHIFTIMIGAYDATSSAISSVLILLALHPDIQERTYQEIVSITNGNFDDENIKKLKYLDMVAKECMRLFPPVPTTFRQATEDLQMGEYLIPAGADVSLNLFELHRDPEQFKNPNEFNPDNFLPENVSKRHLYSFVPFAIGQRNCIGAKLAMVIIKVVVAKVLLSYKVECDYKSIEELKFKGDMVLTFQDKVLVRLLER